MLVLRAATYPATADLSSAHGKIGRRTVPRPSTPLLSRALIVETALAIIDADGAAALSTRRLARELGVSGPSLYNHFATKDEILDAVSDHISTQAPLVASDTWQDALREWARTYRHALVAHPNAVSFMALRPVRHKAALRAYDWYLRELVERGWTVAAAWDAMLAVELLVLGTALAESAPGFALGEPELQTAFPLLTEASSRFAPDGGAVFEQALADLIDGIELRLATR